MSKISAVINVVFLRYLPIIADSVSQRTVAGISSFIRQTHVRTTSIVCSTVVVIRRLSLWMETANVGVISQITW